MSFTWRDVPVGFGADATLAFAADRTREVVLPFPPVNGGVLHWGAGRATVCADGSVSLRMAVYTSGSGWRVSKVLVTNGEPVEVPLRNGDCKIAVCRVSEPGSDATVPVTVAVESLLAS